MLCTFPIYVTTQHVNVTVKLSLQKVCNKSATFHFFSFAACGGTLSGLNGSFTSPNFPKTYPTRVDCEWVIHTKFGQLINLQFQYFDVEGMLFFVSVI